MKNVQRILTAVLFLVIASGVTFAQRDPRGGGPGNGGPHGGGRPHGQDTVRRPPPPPPCNPFGDSCLTLLLSKLSTDDAAALTAALDAGKSLRDQMNTLRQQLKDARTAGDTALFRSLMQQLRDLRDQARITERTIRDIMHRNNTAVRETMAECCPKPPKGPHGNNDPIDQSLLKVSPVIPNPITGGVTTASFTYSLNADAAVTITLHDALGNIVKEIFNGPSIAGDHETYFETAGLHPGMYMLRVQADKVVQSQRIIVQP